MDKKQKRFAALIDEYSPMLYAQIRSMLLNHEDADDVLQNTFMKAWINLDKFNENAAMKTWIFRIAVNESLMHLRRRQSKNNRLGITVNNDLAQNSRHAVMPDHDPAKLLEQALTVLTEKQRLIFGLRYYNNLPYKEISEIT
ncbi:MAG: sigma-70 family RNA polymerase sigma factor, partial [Bacteroidetes bacterium]|nr:sigma-70 family RNA polymerase sigma factor [Bacteroidota bacterium]MBU1578737.1 sigma-70 family RNA polymerase sigma factor [Bacteroidota bacterium]MBU2466804.1 sigma-70 family RNA polymerase sigma factor [Bacteroidota bacterium]